MKKRTSKYASGTRKTSSQSGTSAETVGTENGKGTPSMASVLSSIASSVRKMTPEEFKQSLVESGIILANGELTAEYKR